MNIRNNFNKEVIEGNVKVREGMGEGRNVSYTKENRGGQGKEEVKQAEWRDCCCLVALYHQIFRQREGFGQRSCWSQWGSQGCKLLQDFEGVRSHNPPVQKLHLKVLFLSWGGSPLTLTITHTHTQSPVEETLACLSSGSKPRMVWNKNDDYSKPTTAI